MQIKLDKEFEVNFEIIFQHISKDKISAAKKFRKDLFKKIKNIPVFPKKYRKSIYFMASTTNFKGKNEKRI